jgi:DNA-binding transcriptional LysR family regulator
MAKMHAMHASRLAALDLNLLVILHALLAEGSVTRAAARVSLSQSATSHALTRLRQLLGDPLLVRQGPRLALTPRAVALMPALERGLGELDSAVSGEPPFHPATARRSFSLGMADYGQAVMLPPLLARLHREAPMIDLAANAFPDVFERMDAGTMDMAVIPTAPLPSGFDSVKLFSDGFVCVVRRGHPTVRGPRLTLKRYLALDHVLVAPSGTSGSIVDTVLERQGAQRRVAVRLSNFLAAPIVVSQSDLIHTGPARLLRPLVARHSLRLLAPPLRLPGFDLHLIWHKRRTNDPGHAWLRELIVEQSRQR